MNEASTELSETQFKQIFTDSCHRQTLKMGLPKEILEQLSHHAWRVHEKNKVMNLTGISDPATMALKHTLDALEAHRLLSTENFKISPIVDLGTGAGWPGLSLAMLYPKARVTLLDSTQKKITFLQELVNELNLENRVSCRWGRFEAPEQRALIRNARLITARAVGPLSKLIGWCPGSLNGQLLLWKGPAAAEELKAAATELRKRKLRLRKDHAYRLGADDIERHLLLIQPQ